MFLSGLLLFLMFLSLFIFINFDNNKTEKFTQNNKSSIKDRLNQKLIEIKKKYPKTQIKPFNRDYKSKSLDNILKDKEKDMEIQRKKRLAMNQSQYDSIQLEKLKEFNYLKKKYQQMGKKHS